MKKIMLAAPYDVRIEEAKEPVRQSNEVLLRLLYGGVCGSDLASYRGQSAYISYPRTLGHEFSAEIIEVDSDEQTLKPGMVVTAHPYYNCGHCYPCRRGLKNACINNETMGVQREGAFSELLTMPSARICVGDGLTPREMALIEPFSISYHAVEQAQVHEGDRVLVMGAGAIGILAAVSAKARGATAFICDVSERKVQTAVIDFGLDGGIVTTDTEQLTTEVADLTSNDGFDVVIEATGVASVFATCIALASSGGRVVVVGVSKHSADFNHTELQRKELTVLGSRGATRADFDATIALAQSGFVNLAHLISREYAATDAARAFAEFDEDSASITKAVFKFSQPTEGHNDRA